MRSLQTLTRTLTVATLLLAPICAQGGIQDTLVRKDGRRDRGVQILAMNLDQVRYRRDGESLEVPSHLVAGVQWHEPPEEFGLAEAEIVRGEFANAAELYTDAAGKTSRAPLKLEARFLAAESLVQAANTDPSKAGAAEAALRQLIQENPDNFRLPDATLNLGQALRLGGKASESEQSLRQMEDDAIRGNWGSVWVARAKYERALAQLDQGKAADARNAFRGAASTTDSAVAAGDTDPALAQLKMRSLVGEGETYVREKNYSEAARFFRGLATSAPTSGNTAVAAAAKAGEGEALFLEASEKNDVAGLRRAQLALAEANLLDSDAGDTSAKSCYYMGRTILALGADGESQTFKARANAYFQLVVDYYSGSPWAAPASEELAK